MESNTRRIALGLRQGTRSSKLPALFVVAREVLPIGRGSGRQRWRADMECSCLAKPDTDGCARLSPLKRKPTRTLFATSRGPIGVFARRRNDSPWRYGDNIPMPFMPGERALFRAPVIVEDSIIFANNQEAKVLAIEKSFLSHDIKEAGGAKWTATIPTWLIRLEDNDGDEKAVHMVADESEFGR
jgi:hypothetical protein